MRKSIVLLTMGVIFFAATAHAYKVSGKIYKKVAGVKQPVEDAQVTAWTTDGVNLTNNDTTEKDGSFVINLSASSLKGKKIHLKAVKTGLTGIVELAGSRNWYAQEESETKDLTIWAGLNFLPNANLTAQPIPFSQFGAQSAIPVNLVLDGTAQGLMQSFSMQIAYNPKFLNVLEVVPNPAFTQPDSFFDVFVDIEVGQINVNGNLPQAAPLPIEQFAVDSFFDITYEIEIPSNGETLQVEILPGATLFDPTGMEMSPIPGTTDFKAGDVILPSTPIFVNTAEQWQSLLDAGPTEKNIRPMTISEWDEYIIQWRDFLVEGEDYPDTTFLPAELYVYEDDGSYTGDPAPEGDGLIMVWGDDTTPSGEYASAWVFDYGSDPDLTNCTIQVTVMPPSQSGINAVSFAMVDANGLRRSWWWQVPAKIPYDVPTTVTINTAVAGMAAATPGASGFMDTPGFDITKVLQFDVDENASYIFNPQPVPPFNTQIFAPNWNYWHNLIVKPNSANVANKGIFVKYSQPPVTLNSPDVPLINGWDEVSIYDDLTNNELPYPNNMYLPPRIMADDWKCTDNRPVTDIHWWGSFLGWTQPGMPPIVPTGFHIGIWTDVPANTDQPFSHPGKLIWENICDSYVWNFAGYDVDPRTGDEHQENEACFQYNQFLSEDEWFHQHPMEDGTPNIYWLSIVPIYNSAELVKLNHPWGWKTRPHIFQDDAVRIFDTDGVFPGAYPKVGDRWTGGQHVFLTDAAGNEVSWDLSFELTTNQKPPTPNADINDDGIVDLVDLSIMSAQWLTAGVTPSP